MKLGSYSYPMTVASSVPAKPITFAKPAITSKELKSVLECIIYDKISFGQVVKDFEEECTKQFYFANALSVSSFHSGYHLGLLGMSIKKDDEVIVSSIAPLACLDAIGHIQAKPIIIDISKASFHPNIESILNRITEKTKAIILHYRFGSFKNYSELFEVLSSKKNDIVVMEDISEILRPKYNNRQIGSLSQVSILSFEENMPLTMGKGSVLLTNSETMFNKLKNLEAHRSNHVYQVRYDHNITDYQAAMGFEQLKNLSRLIKRRKEIGNIYLDTIFRSQFRTFFKYPEVDSYGSFPILSSTSSAEIISLLKKKNIESKKILSFEPLHRLLKLNRNEFPNTEKLYQQGVLLPIYPHLTNQDITLIINILKKIVV